MWLIVFLCIALGAQVLKGDVDAAIETHAMYDHINTEHGFIPESFTPVCIYIYIYVCVCVCLNI